VLNLTELEVAGSKTTKSKYETLMACGASKMIKLIDVDSKRTESAGLRTC
jgi:hypothetical protein